MVLPSPLPRAHSRTFKAVSKQQTLQHQQYYPTTEIKWRNKVRMQNYRYSGPSCIQKSQWAKEFHQQKPPTILKHIYSALLHFHTWGSSWIQKAMSRLCVIQCALYIIECMAEYQFDCQRLNHCNWKEKWSSPRSPWNHAQHTGWNQMQFWCMENGEKPGKSFRLEASNMLDILPCSLRFTSRVSLVSNTSKFMILGQIKSIQLQSFFHNGIDSSLHCHIPCLPLATATVWELCGDGWWMYCDLSANGGSNEFQWCYCCALSWIYLANGT